VERVRFEADRLGTARCEHVERGVRRRSPTRLRPGGARPTRPNEFGLNKALDPERWKAAGDLLGRLPLIADELEDFTISVFHQPTVFAKIEPSA
jgi:hypothetical protein